jgi:hypothetical protein
MITRHRTGAQRFLALRSLVLWSALVPGQGLAQVGEGAGPERGVAVISPDTVRVGEAFDLGITAVSSDRLQFPAVLSLSDELEQIGPPRSVRDSAGVWKGVYPLVAWKSGRIEIPEVRIPVVSATTERSLVVRPPAVEVSTVLPPAEEQPGLRPPRMPSEQWSIPWMWLLGLVLAGLLVRELVRRLRAPPPQQDVPEILAVNPLDEARDALLALRSQALAGEARTDQFYDGIETAVRLYLARTRNWPVQSPVRSALRSGLPGEMDSLDRVVQRALPARFGALEVSGGTLVSDVESVLSWLETEEAA